MKKAFITLQFIFGIIIIVGAINASRDTNIDRLSGNTWQFKSLASDHQSTQEYLTTLYNECEYRFADDHTYSGMFFGIAISGTWETVNDSLILNKGTVKEEAYRFSLPASSTLILKGSEKGNSILIEFIKK